MPWGVADPKLLYGDFPGWREAVESAFDKLLSDEQREHYGRARDYYFRVTRKFIREVGVPFPHDPALTPIEPHEFPIEYRLESGAKSLPSIVMLRDQILAVDGQVKSIVERLEPGVHVFSPLRITMPRNRAIPDFHVMVIGRYLDSFRAADSDPDAFVQSSYSCHAKTPNKAHVTGLALSEGAIGNAHLWRERNLARPNIFVSEELKSALDVAGLKLPGMAELRSAA